MEAPGYPDGLTVQEFGRLLDSFIDRFRQSRRLATCCNGYR